MAHAEYEHSTDPDVIAHHAISVHQQYFTGKCSLMAVIHFTDFYNLFNLPKTELSPTMLEGLAGVSKYLDEIRRDLDNESTLRHLVSDTKKEMALLKETKKFYDHHLNKMKERFGLDEGWSFFLKVQDLKFGYPYDYPSVE